MVLFTASTPRYAIPILAQIQKSCAHPDGSRLFKHILFRSSCTKLTPPHQRSKSELFYVKDLSRLGRPLTDTIIIDNCPESYCLQRQNGIPCTSWFEDPDDSELLELQKLLEFVAKDCSHCDVRQIVKRVVTKDNRLCPDWHKSLASLSTVSESNPKPPTLPTVTKQQAQNFFIPDTGSSSQPLPALAPKTLPQTPQPPLKIL